MDKAGSREKGREIGGGGGGGAEKKARVQKRVYDKVAFSTPVLIESSPKDRTTLCLEWLIYIIIFLFCILFFTSPTRGGAAGRSKTSLMLYFVATRRAKRRPAGCNGARETRETNKQTNEHHLS